MHWESQLLRRYDLVSRPTWAINALFHTITMCHWNVVISVHFWCQTIVQNVFKFFSSFSVLRSTFLHLNSSSSRRSLNLSPIVRVMLIFTAHEKHVSTFSSKSHHRYERAASAMTMVGRIINLVKASKCACKTVQHNKKRRRQRRENRNQSNEFIFIRTQVEMIFITRHDIELKRRTNWLQLVSTMHYIH